MSALCRARSLLVNTYDGTTGGISRALEAKSDLQGVDYNAIGLNDAVKALHTAYGLDADQIEAVVYGGTGR